jgi:hypothetical protein
MQAEVFSLDSLDDLDRALATFSSTAAEAVIAMRAEFLDRRTALDDQEEDAQVEVSNWAAALQLADDDEREACACSLSEAQERLSRIRGWQARVHEEHSAFLTRAARFERLLDQTLPRTRDFLKTKTGELRAYGAMQPEPGASAATHGSVSGPVSLSPDGVTSPGPMKLTEHRLPDRFVWVPLAEISEARLAGVATKEAYKKVEYDTMATGLRRLAAEILPRIHSDPDRVGGDAFRSLDEAAGESCEDGLQRIYEAFFGKDFVYLERGRDQEKFEITNGRHRIRVALDLGWDAIPARVKDLRS